MSGDTAAAPGPERAPAQAGPTWPLLALLFNATLWGASWWPFRWFQAHGLHPLWASAFMYALAAALLLAWRPRSGSHLARSPMLWALAFTAGATNAAFNWAVAIGDVVRVVLLFYLTPLWSVLLARFYLAEALSPAVWLRVALALAGALLVLMPLQAWSLQGVHAAWALLSQQGLGLADALAIGGSVLFAMNNVLLRKDRVHSGHERSLAMFAGGAAVPIGVCLTAALVAPGVVAWPSGAPLWALPLLGMCLFFTLGNLALQFGAGRLSAQITAVVMPFEVVVAALTAVWWGQQHITPALAWGGAMIVLAALLAAWPVKPAVGRSVQTT